MMNARQGPTLKPKMSIAIVALAIIASGLSAYFSLIIWILGVGIDRKFHSAMGLAFVAINIGCWVALTYYLRKRKNGVVLGISVAPGPLCIGLVFAIISGCGLIGRQC